eukprot:SAG11_NODE_111_length_16190_cov_9.912808_9_plen_742_part_00
MYCISNLFFLYCLTYVATGSYKGVFDSSRSEKSANTARSLQDEFAEVYLYIYGAGMLIAEGTQILRILGLRTNCRRKKVQNAADDEVKSSLEVSHPSSAALLGALSSGANFMQGMVGLHDAAEILDHSELQGGNRKEKLKDRFNLWNCLDLIIIFEVGTLFCLHVLVPRGDALPWDGMVVVGDGGRSVDVYLRWILSVLCVTSSFRALELLTTNHTLGPMVIMLLRMGKDVQKFMALAIFFVLGFAVAMVPLLTDPMNELSTPYKSLINTALGIIGEHNIQDLMDKSSTFALFSCYLFIMQVILLNLLIAMFSSTYMSVEEKSQEEWEFVRASIQVEYSFEEIDNFFEVAPFSVLLPLYQIICRPLLYLRSRLCGVKPSSWYRFPWEETEDENICSITAKVPRNLGAHRIMQFDFEYFVNKEGKHIKPIFLPTITQPIKMRTVIVCKVPRGVPSGVYVTVDCAWCDVENNNVQIVLGSVHRSVREGARLQPLDMYENEDALGQIGGIDTAKGKLVQVVGDMAFRQAKPHSHHSHAEEHPPHAHGKAPPRTGRIMGLAKRDGDVCKDVVRVRWLDHVSELVDEATEAEVPVAQLDENSFVNDIDDLVVQYLYLNEAATTREHLHMRMSLAATDRSYIAKNLALGESDDLVEALRARWIDSELDAAPRNLESLLDRSWPKDFTAEDLGTQIAGIAEDQEKLHTKMDERITALDDHVSHVSAGCGRRVRSWSFFESQRCGAGER